MSNVHTGIRSLYGLIQQGKACIRLLSKFNNKDLRNINILKSHSHDSRRSNLKRRNNKI